jgi:carbamoyl-phosphate synthase/aspartate carbamoyltransferase
MTGLNQEGILQLSDGSVYKGTSFGASRSTAGELVFQTGMVGYPESLTDPSYKGQVLVITFPLVGNYGVPSEEVIDEYGLQKYFESSKVHIECLIVASYSQDYSHYLAKSSLSEWLIKHNVPALFSIDTRLLTKKIRNNGSMLAKVLFPKNRQMKINLKDNTLVNFDSVEFIDPNSQNLVEKVSRKDIVVYQPISDQVLGPDSKPLHILCVDVGMKNNQIREFAKRGVKTTVVPHNYDFVKNQNYDGLFISNGPGDPTVLGSIIEKLAKILDQGKKPVFGICLGHQLLALAAGAKTEKLLYGNRGHNIPCTDLQTGRCYITSQNHGFAVNVSTLKEGWEPYFTNANDGSNEVFNIKLGDHS